MILPSHRRRIALFRRANTLPVGPSRTYTPISKSVVSGEVLGLKLFNTIDLTFGPDDAPAFFFAMSALDIGNIGSSN